MGAEGGAPVGLDVPEGERVHRIELDANDGIFGALQLHPPPANEWLCAKEGLAAELTGDTPAQHEQGQPLQPLLHTAIVADRGPRGHGRSDESDDSVVP